MLTYVTFCTILYILTTIFSQMQTLPNEIIRHIAQYINIHQLAKAEQATKDFLLPHIKRKKRFQYCRQQIKQRNITNGKCADVNCSRQKLSCIKLEPKPAETQYLSVYCSKHLKKYMDIHINELF